MSTVGKFYKGTQPNFAGNKVDYTGSYMQMDSSVGMAFRNDDNAISYTAFGQGLTVSGLKFTLVMR